MVNISRQNAREELLERHTHRLQAYIQRLEAIDQRFFWIRLWSFVTSFGLALIIFSVVGSPLGWLALLGAAAAFGVVTGLHRRIDRLLGRSRISLQLYHSQLARIRLTWEEMPAAQQPPLAQQPHGHPFEVDLNLTGERSVHRLLDTSLSLGGSRRLQDWLLQPVPDMRQVCDRQSLIKEMIPLTGFRHQLALNSALVTGSSQRWEGERLVEWLSRRPAGGSLVPWLVVLVILAVINVSLYVLHATGVLPAIWIGTLIVYALLYLARYKDFSEMFDDAYELTGALSQFKAVLLYLERYPFQPESRLAGLVRPYQDSNRLPSASIRRLSLIASAASLRGNPIVWIMLNTFLPWDMIFAHLLNLAKHQVAETLPVWLDTWYELEALNSLANFAYLNPDSVFPDLVEPGSAQAPAVFTAQAVGHPLIHASARVLNDFTLDRLGQVVIVTGSNMSGKSTFLRTLGVNLVLAQAGAPVIAQNLRTILFRLFTSMNLSDSLSDGISFFYAEVKRLKSLLLELQDEHALPLFFLIDEIFRGTNNRERAIGSRSYVEAVAGGQGVGVISTHDLELAHLEQAIPGIHNFHFREDIQEDRMVFDYRLRPGPSPTTNALKIMELEGLPVKIK